MFSGGSKDKEHWEEMGKKGLDQLEEYEAVVWGCSAKKMFFEILQDSLENTLARVPFLITLKALNLQLY